MFTMLFVLTCCFLLLWVISFFPNAVLERLKLQNIQALLSPYHKIFSLLLMILSLYVVVQVFSFLLQNVEEFIKVFMACVGILLGSLSFSSLLQKAPNKWIQKTGSRLQHLERFLTHKDRAYAMIVALVIMTVVSALITFFN